MRKKVRIVKRMSCLLLIFLLSINSFATIVSDNDGSAFITKAEFDSLKNSFQSQLDEYNRGIDSTIDYAISSYLTGAVINKSVSRPTVLGLGTKYKMIKQSDISYKMGRISGTINSMMFRGFNNEISGKSFWSNVKMDFIVPNPSDVYFDKMYIDKYDRGTNLADIYGYYKNGKEFLNGDALYLSGRPYTISGMNANSNKYWKLATGASNYQITNVNYANSSSFLQFSFFGGNTALNNFGLGGSVAPSIYVWNFQRDMGTRVDDAIYVVNQTWRFDRFTDFDNPGCNFSNDGVINSNKQKQGDLFNLEITIRGQTAYNNATDLTFTPPWNYSLMSDADKMVYFYEGFCNDGITHWNRLYNDEFDSVAAYPTIKTSTSTKDDSDGNSHLMCYGGVPIVKTNKNEKVEYQLKFEDETKEYDLWTKERPFIDDIPTRDVDVLKDVYAIRGASKITVPTGKNYITVKSGDKLIVPMTTMGSYIFLKWRVKDDVDWGGGTLIDVGSALITSFS